MSTQHFIRSHCWAVLAPIALLWLPSHLFAGQYLDSAHGGYNTPGKGAFRLTGPVAGNCSHCHEQHASIGGSEPEPVNSAASAFLLFDETSNNTLCNYCHGVSQSNGANDIETQIAKTYSHNPNSVLQSIKCLDCHNVHVAQTAVHEEAVGGNTASGAILAVSGVSVNWSPPAAPTAGTENLSNPAYTAKQEITQEYELCFKCHNGSISGLPDIGGQFNPGNYASHPVSLGSNTTWRNAFLTANFATAMNPPWNTGNNMEMYCGDCHGSETSSDPAGPHGSNNNKILKNTGTGGPYDGLCLRCHNVLASSNWNDTNGRDHSYGPHQYPANTLGCIACHGGYVINGDRAANIHGTNYKWPDDGGGTGNTSAKFLVGGELTQNYTLGATRYCAATCHPGSSANPY